MSHIAIPSDASRKCGGLIGFYPDGDVIARKAIHPRTAPAVQKLAALREMTAESRMISETFSR